jgi:diguanylate cyclase
MSEQLIELGLLHKEQHLVDRLLALVADNAIESDTLRTADFRSKLEEFRQRILQTGETGPEALIVMRECLTVCQDYFKRAKTYLLEREAEFAEVIEVLRDAVAKMAGEARSFNISLMNSSERLNRLIEIQDIRELKKQISEQVVELNRIVTEKQKKDEAGYARLSQRVEDLQDSLQKSRQEATLDALTGVANRGAFDRAIESWIAGHKKNNKPFILALLDLDDFKAINDTHGHQVGDRVLLCAAQWFGKYVRKGDFLARYGGEEFAILLTDLELTRAQAKFAELVARIAGCSFEYQKDKMVCEVRFTVSCGVAEYSFDETADELIRRADQALYEAKRTGKNRVILAKKQKDLWRALKPFVRSNNR